MHERIIKKKLEKSPSVQEPIITIITGHSASGKNKLYNDVISKERLEDLVIDEDDIKKLFPEKDKQYVHGESGYVAEELMNRAIEEKKNIIFIANIKDTDKYIQMLDNLKNKGYNIIVRATEVRNKVILAKRLMERTLKGQPVPLHIGLERLKTYEGGLNLLKKYTNEEIQIYDGTKDFIEQSKEFGRRQGLGRYSSRSLGEENRKGEIGTEKTREPIKPAEKPEVLPAEKAGFVIPENRGGQKELLKVAVPDVIKPPTVRGR